MPSALAFSGVMAGAAGGVYGVTVLGATVRGCEASGGSAAFCVMACDGRGAVVAGAACVVVAAVVVGSLPAPYEAYCEASDMALLGTSIAFCLAV